MSNLEPLLTYETAGQYLDCSASKVKKMVLAGELPIVKVGNETRIEPADLRAWIDSQKHFHQPENRRDSKRSEPSPSGEHTNASD